MLFFKRSGFILSLLILMIFFASCMGVVNPNVNTLRFAKKYDKKINLSIAGVNYGDKVLPFASVSWQIKTQEDAVVEVFFFGLRRIDEIHKEGGFYFDIYESAYFQFLAFGVNLGFLAGFKMKDLDFYLSSKLDAYSLVYFWAPASKFLSDYYLNYTPSIGLSFNNRIVKLFIEASFSKKFYSRNSNKNDLDENTYFIHLGISF